MICRFRRISEEVGHILVCFLILCVLIACDRRSNDPNSEKPQEKIEIQQSMIKEMNTRPQRDSDDRHAKKDPWRLHLDEILGAKAEVGIRATILELLHSEDIPMRKKASYVSNYLAALSRDDALGCLEFCGQFDAVEMTTGFRSMFFSAPLSQLLKEKKIEDVWEWVDSADAELVLGVLGEDDVGDGLFEFSSTDFVEKLHSKISESESIELTNSIIEIMAKYSPVETLDLLTKGDADLPEATTKSVRSVAFNWIRDDALSATEWIATLRQGGLRDRIVNDGILRIYALDPDLAWELAGSMTGAKLKQQTVHILKRKDRKAKTAG